MDIIFVNEVKDEHGYHLDKTFQEIRDLIINNKKIVCIKPSEELNDVSGLLDTMVVEISFTYLRTALSFVYSNNSPDGYIDSYPYRDGGTWDDDE